MEIRPFRFVNKLLEKKRALFDEFGSWLYCFINYRCGHHFCYACGRNWRTCDCPLWHENRLLDIVNREVEDEVPAGFDRVARENVFNRIRDGLRRHEDVGYRCEHYRNSQWAWRDRGSLECELCGFHLPEYIFMCKNCRMRACNYCRRHRLR